MSHEGHEGHEGHEDLFWGIVRGKPHCGVMPKSSPKLAFVPFVPFVPFVSFVDFVSPQPARGPEIRQAQVTDGDLRFVARRHLRTWA